ncbi:farnesyltransferase subunit beta-like protein [Pavlovales sp. CCMP2436]|nr:farnesyltransferase subunit beta-like protein [Pavlovales sp. CCMP2436]
MFNVIDCDRWTIAPPALSTKTTQQQASVEEKCLGLYMRHLGSQQDVKREEITLAREQHIRYLLAGLERLSSGYQVLDSSRPWLCYWILHGLDLLGHDLDHDLSSRIVGFLKLCQDPAGGYCGGPFPGQLPHLAPSYAAINALVIIGTEEAYHSIDRQALHAFLRGRKGESGHYTMHEDGEVDVRGAYTAMAVATLTGILSEELTSGTADWISQCQTYEGGLGGEPGLEAHGGYTFCGAAALSLLGRLDALKPGPLLAWLTSCQKRLEGGFHGRTNKLVQVTDPSALMSSLREADGTWLFDQTALQDYLLVCGQPERGGMRDKPGKDPDFYHTCYCLSGLAIAEHSTAPNGNLQALSPYGTPTLLRRIDPRFNISQGKVDRALRYFSALGPLPPTST